MRWLDLGDPSGVAALYLHGTPSLAREADCLDDVARDAGVRLVAPDRPGYLGSQARPGTHVGEVAKDLVDLVDGLGLSRFAVAGFSGGSGFALAVGAAVPERVTTVIVGGGMGAIGSAPGNGLPAFTRILFATAALRPRISRLIVAAPMYWVAHRFRRDLVDPKQGTRSMLRGAARGAQVDAVEQYVASRSVAQLDRELRDRIRSFRSLEGIVIDLGTYGGPWRVDLSSLTMPVEIWHGQDDPAVPVAFAKATGTARSPGCTCVPAKAISSSTHTAKRWSTRSLPPTRVPRAIGPRAGRRPAHRITAKTTARRFSRRRFQAMAGSSTS